MAAATSRLPAIGVRTRTVIDRHSVAILTIVLLVVLAALLTRWAWFFLQPRETAAPTQASVALDANSSAANIVNAHIFGSTSQARGPDAAQVSSLNVRLKGVFAFSQDSPAFAIVNTGAKNDDSFKSGDEIISGVVLDSVYPGHILIKRAGLVERVNLEERVGSAGTPAPRIQPRSAAPPPSPGNFNLSRGELQKSLQDPKQLANLGRVNANPGGGVLVEEVPTGSLAENLGLKPGDVIRTLNGSSINSASDLATFYKKVSQRGEGSANQILVEGSRGGRPLNLTYNVQQ